MSRRKFWPLDLDPEGEIYENIAWDLPGYNRHRNNRESVPSPRRKRARK
ncbi:MAG TPA: hypothetical protein VJ732_01970 [Bryobacteraceae bacterium]|nr:hypothetical protein [Bryobacteraceae bacterium]